MDVVDVLAMNDADAAGRCAHVEKLRSGCDRRWLQPQRVSCMCLSLTEWMAAGNAHSRTISCRSRDNWYLCALPSFRLCPRPNPSSPRKSLLPPTAPQIPPIPSNLPQQTVKPRSPLTHHIAMEPRQRPQMARRHQRPWKRRRSRHEPP